MKHSPLKHLVMAAFSLLLLLGAQVSVHGASDGTCQTYARGAVAVASSAKTIPCPLSGPSGRWSARYEDHYNWCRTVKNRTLDDENAARSSKAKACADNHATCNGYASNALLQRKRINDLRCAPAGGTSVGRWSPDTAQHYNWCRIAISRSVSLKDETAAREKTVTRCARCDLYAHGAVASTKRLEADGCGGFAYGQGRWSEKYEDHFAWCLQARESTQNDEDRARDNEFKACARGRAGSGAGGGAATPPPSVAATPKPCGVAAQVEAYECLNEDGSVADFWTPASFSTCGVDEADAIAAADRQFRGSPSIPGCLGDAPGCCRYRATYAKQPCACTFQAGRVTSALTTASNVWSAFASNGQGRWGHAAAQSSFIAASKTASNACGGAAQGCRVFGTSTQRCIAFAESRQSGYWYAAGGGEEQSTASANALRLCQSGTAPPASCRIAMSACR